jgi:hypothetical protein
MAQQQNSGSGMDYPAHERTYAGFVTFTTWGSIVVTGIVVFMAVTLL